MSHYLGLEGWEDVSWSNRNESDSIGPEELYDISVANLTKIIFDHTGSNNPTTISIKTRLDGQMWKVYDSSVESGGIDESKISIKMHKSKMHGKCYTIKLTAAALALGIKSIEVAKR